MDSAAQSPPNLSADGRYWWDGYRWWRVRPSTPWQLTIARVLVFVQSGFLVAATLVLSLFVGLFGGFSRDSFNPIVMLLAGFIIVAAAQVLLAIVIRRRWAYWTLVCVETLQVLATIALTIFQVVSSPTGSTSPLAPYTSALTSLVLPGATLICLLARASRNALR